MASEQAKKLNNDTIQNLQSANSEVVADTLNQLSETGNSAYIPFLVELLHSTQNPEIKKRVTSLLSELKHSDAIPLIIEAIQNQKYTDDLQYLVSACWENGMDYSAHLPLFVDLMLEQDFMVAFEAHTVITNMTGKISSELCGELTQKIQAALPSVDEGKRGLLEEILDFLPALEAGIDPMEY